MEEWAGAQLGMSDINCTDQTGRGNKSQISDQLIARARMHIYESYPGFKGLLGKMKPRDGEDKIDKSPTAIIHAKTRTVNFITSLAGYAP